VSYSPRRKLVTLVAFALGAWAGVIFALLFLLHASARTHPPKAWERINAQVNTVDRRYAATAPEGDPDGVFDCEDYAWAKYHALAALGVAKERMRLFAVTVADGRRHMILVADGWVLDNLEPRLEPEAKARTYYRDWQDRTNAIVIP